MKYHNIASVEIDLHNIGLAFTVHFAEETGFGSEFYGISASILCFHFVFGVETGTNEV